MIEEIHQKNSGNFVNLELEAGTPFFNKEDRFYIGVLLKQKTHSKVNKHEIIALVYSSTKKDAKTVSNNFFTITK